MRKVAKVTKKVICMLCFVLLLTDLMPLSVAAENGVINEVIISEGIMEMATAEIEKEAITLEDFIWPNEAGQYSYTLDGVTAGKKYLLMVIPGIYKSLEGLTQDEIVSSLLYLDQKTADGPSVDFRGFIPAKSENCTVLVSGEGMPVSIAGYISKDIYSFGIYVQDAESRTPMEDSFEVERNATWEGLLSTLPQKGYMEIFSDYADTLYCPVVIQWRESKGFKTTKIGHMFRVIGDVIPENPDVLGGFSALCKPIVVNVAVVDKVRIPVSIIASKDQIVYGVGSVITDNDIHLKLLYSDGSSQTVTGWTTNAAELSTEEAGTKKLEISYTNQGITLTTDLEIYVAGDDEVLHQVSFETFGGSIIETIMVKDGDNITLLEEPEKKGFWFTGWYTDRYRTKKFNEATPITEDIKLYAGWMSIDNPVVEGIDVVLKKSYFKLGDMLDKEMILVHANYSDGTRVKVENFETNLSEIDQNTIGKKVLEVSYSEGYYVKKNDVEFHILSSNGNEFVTVSFETGCDSIVESQTIAYGGTVTVPYVDLEKIDSVFAGWYYGDEKWDFENNTVTEDITLRAKWLQKYGETDIVMYTEELSSYEYTGKAIKPAITVMDQNMNVLVKGKDYTVRYYNNVNSSVEDNSASAVITGKGNYTGGFTMKFTILPKNIESDGVSASCTEVNLYNQKGYSPVPNLKYGGKKLKKGTDYTVQYYKCSQSGDETSEEIWQPVPATEKLKEIGTYKIVAEGKGNYTGTREFEYRIVNKNMKNLSSAKIELDSSAKKLSYTGEEQKINSKIKVKLGSKTVLKEGVDYEVIYPENITDVGKKTVTICALPTSTLCYGQKTVSYEVTGLAISKASVVLNAKSVQYQSAYITDNIKSITIKATKKNKDALQAVMKQPVKVNDICSLVEGRDYQVTYRKNEKAGKASVIIEGKGLFSGKVTKNFEIKAVDLNDSAVTVNLNMDTVAYCKGGTTTKASVFFRVDDQEQKLKEGRDYTVKYSGNKKIGTAKIKISGKGNFKGTVEKTYNIVAKPLRTKDIKVTVTNPLQKADVPDSTVYKPVISVTDNGLPVSEKEYLIEYSKCVTQADLNNNISIGYITLKEKEGSSYTGSRIVPYQVLSNSIEASNCTFVIKDQTYTGKAIIFNASNEVVSSQITGNMSLGDGTSRELVLGEDFEVIGYKNNLKPGEATITIKGIGDFTGTKKLTFTIQKCKL